MKLRSLFLSTLVVCAFASCSKDDDGIKGPVEPVDAYISVAATALPQVRSKAEEDTEKKNNETFINELHAFVFKVPAENAGEEEKMTLVGQQKVSADGDKSVSEIKHIIVKVTPDLNNPNNPSADQFKLVLVANPGKDLFPTTLADLRKAVLTKSIEQYPFSSKPHLPMVSDVIDVKGLVPSKITEGATTTYRENWVDNDKVTASEQAASDDETSKPTNAGTISLTRLVARVQVEKIESTIESNYPGATFQLTNLALVNVRPLATMEGGTKKDSYEYVKGFQSANYEASQEWIYPGFQGAAITEDFKASLSHSYENKNIIFSNDYNSWKPEDDSEDKFYSYAFPNSTDATCRTALLITGIFKRRAADEQGEIKNFRVILQDKDKGEQIEVLRNNVYKLNITISGEGSSNEDKIELNAHVSATIETEQWQLIVQNETDTN